MIELTMMNCDLPDNKYACSNNEISSLPTIMIFNHNGKRRAAQVYKGPRTADALMDWVKLNERKPFLQLGTATKMNKEI